MTPQFDKDNNQRYVALILRYGSLLSMAIMALGLGLVPVRGVMVHTSDPSASAAHTRWVQEAAMAMMRGGILLLLLTPVFRVVLATINFALESDGKYVLISLGVLAIVLLGIGYSFNS